MICPNCKQLVNYQDLFEHYKKKHNTFSRHTVELVFSHFDIDLTQNQLNTFLDKTDNAHFDKTKFYLDNLDLYTLEKEVNSSRYKEEIEKYLERINAMIIKIQNDEQNKLLNKIKQKYVKLPSKFDYEKFRINCIFCNKVIHRNSSFEHIKANHIAEAKADIINYFKKSDISISNKMKKWLSQKDYELNESIKKETNTRFSRIKKNVDYLSSLPYFEESRAYQNTLTEINNILSNIKYPNIENNLISEYSNVLSELKVKLPNKKEYIQKHCTTVYVTWHDLYFQERKLKIKPSKGIYRPIELKGSLRILNEIKESYFLRLYSSEVYKLRFTNGVLNKFVSPALFRIQSIINHRIQEIENRNKPILNNIRDLTGHQIIDLISRGKIKNKYLIIPAKMLQVKDKVVAIMENNNDYNEECLLFIFIGSKYNCVLWENQNMNRAGYIFTFLPTNFTLQLSKLKDLITSKIKYKRMNLWSNVDLERTFTLTCKNYWSLVHDHEQEYENKLIRIIKSCR